MAWFLSFGIYRGPGQGLATVLAVMPSINAINREVLLTPFADWPGFGGISLLEKPWREFPGNSERKVGCIKEAEVAVRNLAGGSAYQN
jgi:hypothetical protein